jgi:hypothetical protein
MHTKMVTAGSWTFAVSPHTLYNPGNVNEKISQILLGRSRSSCVPEWANSFAYEPTWAQRVCGVPSLLVRLDMTVCPNEGVHMFEIEERPGGLAVDAIVNSDFKDRMRALLQEWKVAFGSSLEVVASPQRTEDLELYESELGIPVSVGKPRKGNTLVIVRAEPDEGFGEYRDRSISPISTKGDKGYGLPMGLWSRVNETTELPWDEGFALKASVGSKMRGVWLYNNNYRAGAITQDEARAFIRKKRAHFIQEWIEPENQATHSFLPEGYLLARRVFFGYSPNAQRFVCIGGFWNARPNIRIHGASDVIVGPVSGESGPSTLRNSGGQR